jgi:homoserine kinase
VSAARVRVPATSANLGPAFDCAGLALSRHDVIEFAVQPSGLAVEVSGVGAGELPADESHLVVRAFRAACAELGWSPPGLRVVAENAIPQGRGMGSSAAAVVAGVLGAWALCPDVEVIDLDAVLRLVMPAAAPRPPRPSPAGRPPRARPARSRGRCRGTGAARR